MTWIRVALAGVAITVAAGCGESEPVATERSGTAPAERTAPGPPRECFPGKKGEPCVAGAEVGVRYPYRLYTHCGVLGAYFDGRWWRARPPLSDGSGNPPEGWGNPFEDGTLTLLEGDVAEFEAQLGQTVRFVRLGPEAEAPYFGCA